jgi:hypothetical protein
MGCPSEVEIGDNLVFSVTTHTFATGALTDADGNPVYAIYEDETAAEILSGSMAKLDDAGTTGFYTESIACTSGNGFENGKTYTIYITAAVASVTGGISFGFKAYDQRKANATQISGDSDAADNAESFFDGTGYAGTKNVIPTVTAITNGVTLADGAHGGANTVITLKTAIQADAYSISGDSAAADNLELFFDGTGYDAAKSTVGTVTTLTGHTAQTGDVYAKLPANFEHLSITDTTGLVALQSAQKVDVDTIKTKSVACNDNVTISAYVGTAAQDTAQSGDLYAIGKSGGKGDLEAILTDTATIPTFPSNFEHLSITDVTGLVSISRPTGAVVTDAGNSATAFKTNLSSVVDNFWNGAYLKITSGALLGQVRKVSDYDGTNKIITVSPAFTGIPADDVTFALINE